MVNALAGDLLKEGVTPLYNVVEGNEASLELALQVGFVDTSAREVMAHAARL